MGYESKLYIAEKSCISGYDDGTMWANVLASFDLCKVYDVSGNIRENYPDTNCYIYIGDERVTEDCYGDKLKEIPVNDMISIIADAMKKDKYRRYAPCLALLNAFSNPEWDNVVVLHYGH